MVIYDNYYPFQKIIIMHIISIIFRALIIFGNQFYIYHNNSLYMLSKIGCYNNIKFSGNYFSITVVTLSMYYSNLYTSKILPSKLFKIKLKFRRILRRKIERDAQKHVEGFGST